MPSLFYHPKDGRVYSIVIVCCSTIHPLYPGYLDWLHPLIPIHLPTLIETPCYSEIETVAEYNDIRETACGSFVGPPIEEAGDGWILAMIHDDP